MEKITNIAEMLEGCPKGMELYSPIFGEVYLDKIRPHLAIVVTTDKEYGVLKEEFLYDGRYGMNGECMLFPSKGKTTWEGFVPPCEFKDGDIVATTTGSWIGITEGGKKSCFIPTYCAIRSTGEFVTYFGRKEKWQFNRLATEEEKEKLFKAIKENGYKWDAETKTLEKLVNKFDISSLKPFQKLLVRDSENQTWKTSMWECYQAGVPYPYFTMVGCFKMCIPYESNEHLLGTTNDCDEYYKIWE